MFIKTIYIFSVTLLLLISLPSFSQTNKNDSEKKNPLNYNEQELDSISVLIVNEFYKGNYDVVLKKTPALLKNSSALGSTELELRFINILGSTLIKLDDYEGAESIFKDALKVAKQKKDTMSITSTYANLGNTYFKVDNNKALEYYKIGLQYKYTGLKHDLIHYLIHNNIAETYLELNNTELAAYHLKKAREKENSKALDRQRITFTGIRYYIEGKIYLLENKPQEAINEINKSLELKDHYDLSYLITNYKNLIEAYRRIKDYENVNKTYKAYDSLKDIQYEKDKIKQLQIARIEINYDKIEQDLEQVKLENELAHQKASKNNLYLIFFSILTLLLLLVAFAIHKAKNKQNDLLVVLKEKNNQYLESRTKAESLAKSNTRFLSTISHELRTPLYGIIGLSSSFLNDPKLKDFQDDFRSLKFSADYLLALVNDILNMNKIASKKGIELKESHFRLDVLLDNIIQTFSFLNEKNNNSIKLNLGEDLPEVLLGDKTKISQVLMNLISNASKFTEDGSIVIKVIKKEAALDSVRLYFEIKDTGRGIHPEDQNIVFEEFAQVKESIYDDDQIVGTGLGLPIVNKILKALNSHLEMESAYNVGTTFYFTIDVKIGENKEIEQEYPLKQIQSLKDKIVLIVDDNKINQLVTQKVLEQHGIIHKAANNGLEAVEMVKNETFDFILMDINMPVMNGIEATIKIRDFNKSTPIIALTATNFTDPENEILQHGMNSIVLKPYNNETLLNSLLKEL